MMPLRYDRPQPIKKAARPLMASRVTAKAHDDIKEQRQQDYQIERQNPEPEPAHERHTENSIAHQDDQRGKNGRARDRMRYKTKTHEPLLRARPEQAEQGIERKQTGGD